MYPIKEVTYLRGYALRLTFANGVEKVVDLEPYLHGEIFEPVRDMTYFQTVTVNPDLDTIVWANGADLAPEFLYEIGTDVAAPAEAQAR